MPTYEFQCDRCNNEQEAFLPISRRKGPITCVKCGGPCNLIPSVPAYVYVKGDKKPKPKEDPDWNYSLGCRNNDKAISARRKELEAKGTNVDIRKT